MLLRRASLRDVAPAGALALTQALWFSVPLILRHWQLDTGIEPWGDRFGTYYFMWIGIGHSVQYLWITSYYARIRSNWTGQVPYYVKVLLAGAAIWTLPTLIFAPHVLGRLPFDAGLGILAASCVNIHHFILDGAIWKLRDGRVARVLIRREEAEPVDADPVEPSPGRPWLAAAIYAAGALATLAVIGAIVVRDGMLHPALRSGDLSAAHAALDRLEWVRHDGPEDYRKVGNLALQQKRYGEAAGYYQESLERHRSAETYLAVARLARESGREDDAVAAWEHALALNPNQIDALYQLGSAWLRRGDPERAIELLEHAARVAPTDVTVAATLERARKRVAAPAGDADDSERL